MKSISIKKGLLLLLVFITNISLFAQTIPSYYNGVDLSKTGNELFIELSSKVTDTHISLAYGWEVLRASDEDPSNDSNVLLIYGFNDADGISKTDRTRSKLEIDQGGGDSGKWNREHVFAKSLANPNLETGSPGPGTDYHNLRAADADQNSERSNRKFTDGLGNPGISSSNGGWYPGDEWKGDVARIVLYMYLRYNGDGSRISETQCNPIDIGFGSTIDLDSNMIDLFLKWNAEDPVSDFEDDRNDSIESYQGNRNPFIDNPYLATVIWGDIIAEDRWWSGNSNDDEAPSVPVNLIASNITDETVDVSWDASTDNVGIYDYLIYLDGEYLQTSKINSTQIIGLTANTSYEISIKARDASSNFSEESEVLNVTTAIGPKILVKENFDDCNNLSFYTYSEASNKDWACESQFGENNSGAIGLNGYQEDEYSKDWLIANNQINFELETNEKLSFYVDAAYGSSTLELVYSTDYKGSGNPGDFTWNAIPGVEIPIHSDGSSTEEVHSYKNIDLNSLTGLAYVAFKYYSNGDPTRWTVDSFKITADLGSDDLDEDGVLNENDLCPNTPSGETVNSDGCSENELDDDQDGISNALDSCPNTPIGSLVDSFGCFTLAENNFKINAIGETCENKNNGQLAIEATATNNYSVNLNGNNYNFSNELLIDNLSPGTYDFCISVENTSYEQCYILEVAEGVSIAGKTEIKGKSVAIEITKGTPPFKVFLNGNSIYNTSSPFINVEVNHNDLIEIESASFCEGIYSEKINLNANILAYPNPSNGIYNINIPNFNKEVEIEIYNMQSQLISKGSYKITLQGVKLTIENHPKGIYFVKVNLDEPLMLKLIKE